MSTIPALQGLATPAPLPKADCSLAETGLRTEAQMSLIERAERAWNWLRQNRKLNVFAQRNRRLRVNETISLGEKRFVSIIEVDSVSFLIGSSAQSVTLLAQLPSSSEEHPFRGVLQHELHKERTV